MNYASGEVVKLGDQVGLGNDSRGVIVCVFDSSQYSKEFRKEEWSYLKKGALVKFEAYGLIHYENATTDPDLKFIARGSVPNS